MKAKERGRNLWENVIVFSVLILVVMVAEFVIKAFHIPGWIIPPPSAIVSTLMSRFRDIILPEAVVTLKEVFGGFAIGACLGIVLGAFIAQYKFLDKLLSPYILTLVTMPTVALVPLLMLWFGFGITTKIIAVVIASFPPIMMNTITGLLGTESLQLDLMNSLGASKLQTFIKVRFPSALPSVFTGLTIGGIGSVVTAVAAEFVGGSRGLGNRLIYFASTLETTLLYSLILVLALIGIGIYLTISYLRGRVVRWVR
ncbi:MAG: ABC transporter permease [Firmicutes bacterium]|nr:ABC transporter permease [Bacillota bacterium]